MNSELYIIKPRIPILGDLYSLEQEEYVIDVSSNKNSEQDQLQKLKEKVEGYRRNPFTWIEEWLGIPTTSFPDDIVPEDHKGPLPLWSKQREILEKLFTEKKVAVRSGHGVGKTFDAAIAALTIFNVFEAVGIVTAPTFRQVKRMVWGEIHKIYNAAEVKLQQKGMSLGGKLNKTSLEMSGKWYMEGFSTDKAENYQGFHQKTLLLILDEAGQLEREIYDAVEGILTSSNSYVLAIGNPIDPTNPFKDLFEPGSGYYPMQINCYDSPNVRHKQIHYPELVESKWVERMERKYIRNGKKTNYFLFKVEGNFPKESEDTLIEWEYIRAALDRDNGPANPSMLSCDVARMGMDRTVYGCRYANNKFRILEKCNKQRETETAGKAIKYLNETNAQAICVDDIGLGGGVTDILYEQDKPVIPITVNKTPEPWEDEEGLFLNKRAAYYYKLKLLFENGSVDIDDEDLAREIYQIKIEYTSSGKIKIIAKEKYKAKYGYSPDLADSMMLAFSEEEDSETDSDIVRFV